MSDEFDSVKYYAIRVGSITAGLSLLTLPVAFFQGDLTLVLDYMFYGALVFAILGFLAYSASAENKSHDLTGDINVARMRTLSASTNRPPVQYGGTGDVDAGIKSYLAYGGGILFFILLVIRWLI